MTLSTTIFWNYAECRVLCIVMLRVVMLNVIILNAIMLNVVMLSVTVPLLYFHLFSLTYR